MEDNKKAKKSSKRATRKTVFGIKLPPIEPGDDSEMVKTATDFDPAYYSMIDGRPIRPNTSISFYKHNIKNICLKKTLIGFVEDEILRIVREIKNEKLVFEKASKHFDDYQHSFDKFLAYDNDKTIDIMKQSDTLAKDLNNLTEDQKKVNHEMACLKSKLKYIDETLMILISFEGFIHKASPVLWQESNNIKFDVKHEEIVEMSNDIYQPMNIIGIKEKLDALLPPRLYFDKPDQLLTVFESLEKQNLNYLLVTEELNSQKNKFLKYLAVLKSLLEAELGMITKKMQEIEDIIFWNEQREKELKDMFFRILEHKIKMLISSEMALQLHTYIEYTYEKIIAPNDTKLSLLEMTLALESEYNNIMLDLSVFDLNELKTTEKETYANEIKDLKQAKQASKLLKDVDKLSRRLKSSYEPSRAEKTGESS